MENLIKIPKPNLGQFNPAQLVELLDNPDIAQQIARITSPNYLYYNEIKGLVKTAEQPKLWALAKLQRKYGAKPIPPLNFTERNFTLNQVFMHDELLYKLSNAQNLKGNLVDEVVASAAIENSKVLQVSSKRMLLEKASPESESEELVKMCHELYKVVANKPRFSISYHDLRSEKERFVYAPNNPNKICYIAPRREVFMQELEKLTYFANNDDGNFYHPVIKAFILHFWVLILNPLPKFSGILARAAQYWYLKKHGITLPLSAYIKSDLDGYTNAISYSAQDDNDFTYFLNYMMQKLAQAIENEGKNKGEQKEFEEQILPKIQRKTGLNQRQIKLLYQLQQIKNARTNFSSYMKINNICRRTAANDLKTLEDKGYLAPERLGKNVFYYLKQSILKV